MLPDSRPFGLTETQAVRPHSISPKQGHEQCGAVEGSLSMGLGRKVKEVVVKEATP